MNSEKLDKSATAERIAAPQQTLVLSQDRTFWKWAWIVLALGYLWFHLINSLRLEWSNDPQYSYGLVVPLLVAGLLLRRWQEAAAVQNVSPAASPWPLTIFCGLIAFLYLPTRLIEESNPEWRPLQWVLTAATIGLTLFAVYFVAGKGWLRQLAFPILFFFVAVPWPSPVEQPIIQGLSRLNAIMVVNVLSILNIPAMAHGNVIEVSTGVVGINDACSGIRSLQSSLMISLFLGEYYRFNWSRRLLLVPTSFVLAMILNLCRASLLTWIAAKKGVEAIAQYHDEAGMTILLICTGLLWGTAWWFHQRQLRQRKGMQSQIKAASSPVDPGARRLMLRRALRFGSILLIWLVTVELSVALWYKVRESHLKVGPDWTVKLPEQNPTFKALALTPEEHELLRFDEGKKGEWRESDGTEWQAFYFNWLPGRVAGYLAKRHTPDICMTATGFKMDAGPELSVIKVNNLQLPVRHYVFDSSSGPLQVYQCHWEAGMGTDTFTADESSRFNLIRGVWAGRGNQGQKSLEIIISGYNDPKLAQEALVRQLSNLIVVEN